jgi:hypothetical protein
MPKNCWGCGSLLAVGEDPCEHCGTLNVPWWEPYLPEEDDALRDDVQVTDSVWPGDGGNEEIRVPYIGEEVPF